MTTVSTQVLKANLARFLAAAAAGAEIVVTRRNRPLARLSAANLDHVRVGARSGKATPKPLFRRSIGTRALETLLEDRYGDSDA